MRRFILLPVLLAVAATFVGAATLEQLTLDQMIEQSTAIVQGRVTGLSPMLRNSIIYTCYQVQVTNRWKGPSTSQQTVCVAGGTANGIRQSFPGAPQLLSGQEYVLFLWAGKSGMNQLIGLSQGVFDIHVNAQGQQVAGRPAITEMMLDPAGRQVSDQPVLLGLRDLSDRITSKLAGGRSTK